MSKKTSKELTEDIKQADQYARRLKKERRQTEIEEKTWYCHKHIPDGYDHDNASQTTATCCVCGQKTNAVLLADKTRGWHIDHALAKANALSQYKQDIE